MIGLRREDKSDWETRVPLVPDDVRMLHEEHGIEFAVEESPIRVFTDAEYAATGARLAPDLRDCSIILGVKEVPPDKLEPGKAYLYFSHTIKGQPANMPALRRLLELGCTLIDYERIVDDRGRRLVFFGRFAGLAGMIDTLWALGQRLKHEGLETPFSLVKPAHRYQDLGQFEREFRAVAEAIRAGGLPDSLRPFVCGFAGYGQVSQGAQQIFDQLPVEQLTPEQLLKAPSSARNATSATTCYKVVFREEHLVRRKDASSPFALQEYYDHPERYAAAFFPFVEHLNVLVNGIYWEPKYPRLMTREQLHELYSGKPPRLRVVGDISCDIDGSLACTTRATDPGNPVYVYNPRSGETRDGIAGNGPVVLAVDMLPCELPVDASRYFSRSLRPFVPGLAHADLSGSFENSNLPPELRRATIVFRGALTEPYTHLAEHLR
ncbi:MAG: hypothetical protein JSV80_08370 [Acidobacteriota bacterium]|nr:MAG: hypothetical protein JSV80_08370 [Acidobacteriota bacterium]